MPHENFIKGDLISGPVSRNFSYSSFDNNTGKMMPPQQIEHTPIHEIALNYLTVKDGFTHTAYWENAGNNGKHLEVLRQALALYPSTLT